MDLEYFPKKVCDSMYVRPLQEEDANELFKAVDDNRDYLTLHLPWVVGNTAVEHSLAFIRFAIKQQQDQTGLHCGIFEVSGQLEKVVGCVGLRDMNRSAKTAEMGYWLARDHIGCGLCTGACRILIEYGELLGIDQFQIHAGSDNKKSQALAERLGFRKLDGEIRNAEVVNGHSVNHVVYLLKHKQKESALENNLER